MDDSQGKHSLTGFVFNKLREDILSGSYKQNDELKELNIAKELSVSRTPVREAICRLELEGLVKVIPNKATYVVGISDKDIQDIYEMRAMLERMCIKHVFYNKTNEIMDKLEEIIELGEFYSIKGNYQKVLEYDNEFHDLLYSVANSKLLKHTLSDFHHYLQRVRKITLANKERAISSNDEHKAIVEALKNNNLDEAMDLAEKHISNTVENMYRNGYWS